MTLSLTGLMILRRTSPVPVVSNVFTFGSMCVADNRRQFCTRYRSEWKSRMINSAMWSFLLISRLSCVFFCVCHKLTVPRITTTISFLKNDPTTGVLIRFGVSDVTILHGSQLSNLVQKHRFPWRISQIFWMYPRSLSLLPCFCLFDGSVGNNCCHFTN